MITDDYSRFPQGVIFHDHGSRAGSLKEQ